MSAVAGRENRAPRAARRRTWPWQDRGGRFSTLRAATLLLLVAPALLLGGEYLADALGARKVNALIHGTGLWAVRFLLLSLAVTPLKATLGWTKVAQLRRMIGLGAMCYAIVHLLLYVIDQNWALLHVAAEIARRFYLTIGFASLLVLVVLGCTSTDAAMARMGPRWKRLHRWIYPTSAVVLLHYFLQIKADVSPAVVAAGVLIWLLLWRRLPAGRDREPLVLAGLAFATAALTALAEFAWYSIATHASAVRVLLAETELDFGPGPVGRVLVSALVAAGVVALRRLSQRGGWAGSWRFGVALYGGGALLWGALLWAFGGGLPDTGPGDPPLWLTGGTWLGPLALLGVARGRVPDGWPRRVLDALSVACLAYPAYALAPDDRIVALAGTVGTALLALGLAARLWPVSRAGALLVVPVAAWVGYAAATLV